MRYDERKNHSHSIRLGIPMIDTLLNILLRCPHRRLTRPITPVGRGGVAKGGTYVVCLDCAKQFAYDLEEMRVGKPIERSSENGVLEPGTPMARKTKVKLALWASLPMALFAGWALKPRKSPHAPPDTASSSGSTREK